MNIDRKKLLALRKREKEKKHTPKPAQKEFTARKPLGKFFFYRSGTQPNIIQVHISGLASFELMRKPVEEVLEQCEYMTSAPPIRLSKNEFAKLEKWITPLPKNIEVM